MHAELTVRDVFYSPGRFPLLRGINLTVEAGVIILISGRSGSGKSSLLEICAGLKRPDRGTIFWGTTDIARLSREELLVARQRIGYVFQQHALIANYSVFENIALPLRSKGTFSEYEIGVRVRTVMEEVALFGVEHHFPESLSGGQLRSASIARALVTDPDILFVDEPAGGQDPDGVAGIRGVLIDQQRRRRKTIVSVSHDPDLWEPLACGKYILRDGRLEMVSGSTTDRLPTEIHA